MKIEITAKPVFWINLTADEIQLIKNCALSHYDRTCISAAKVGGFIYGWDNALRFDNEAKISASFREIDIVLKCLEIGYHNDDWTIPSQQLSMTLRRALFKSNDELSKFRFTLDC